jgi:NAD(P) transhydrogenase subunit alpha
MRIGAPRAAQPAETRVALIPETVKKLASEGHDVLVEAGAGALAGLPDAAYVAAGGRVEAERRTVLACDVVVAVAMPSPGDCDRLAEGGVLVGLLRPLQHPLSVEALVRRRVTSFSFEYVPRITRAQSMDVLSSMATVAGYRAVTLAAEASPRFFPMLMTAAGTITAAHVLVIGAGVAGLQAIGTAKRLGAIVYGYDVRPAVRQEVESLGARFVELPADVGGTPSKGGYATEQTAEQQARQRLHLADTVAGMDVVITTAAVPDRRAPLILDSGVVARMRPGSVIVDLAAESGGNCELTRPGEHVVTEGGVIVLGPVNIAASMPLPSSQMYSRNAHAFLRELAPKGTPKVDLANEVLAGAAVTHDGEVLHAGARAALGLPAPAEARR